MSHSLFEIENLKLIKQAETQKESQAQVMTQMPQTRAADAQAWADQAWTQFD